MHPPPPGKAWIDYATWDDRVERFRIRALHYRRLVEVLTAEGTTLVDSAREFTPLTLVPALEMTPYPHQREALAAWVAAGRLGVVVLRSSLAAGACCSRCCAQFSTLRLTAAARSR